MRKFNVTVENVSPFLIIGELLRSETPYQIFFDSKGSLTSAGFVNYVRNLSKDCPFSTGEEFEKHYSLRFVRIERSNNHMELDKIIFSNESYWSSKTCYYEILSNGEYFFHPLPYFMLLKSLQMLEKRFERIADFAIEMPDLKFFNYHGPFSPDNYFTIAKEIGREIILYTNSNQFQLKKRVAFQRIGRFRVKNPKVEEPLYLFVKKDEPSRIFVVYNTNGI